MIQDTIVQVEHERATKIRQEVTTTLCTLDEGNQATALENAVKAKESTEMETAMGFKRIL